MINALHHVRYNRWATARTMESVRPLPPELLHRNLYGSYGSVRGALLHIYQADCVWWARLHGRLTGSLSEFQPPDSIDAWEQQWLALLDHYLDWAQSADWNQVIAYKDSKGTPYQSPVWQVLLHLTNHDTYHRGQVANMLRQLGHAPLGTDLILYYRALEADAAASR
jgi:uncharacterized damage-inducible protein DinB